MKIFAILLTCSLLSQSLLTAQGSNWRKYAKTGEELSKKGAYLDAAQNFEQAYRINEKASLLYEAGQNFLRARDYPKAVESFQQLMEKDKEFPLVRYYFARSLKQNDQCEVALPHFQNFISQYQQKDRDRWTAMAQRELEGCKLLQSVKNTDQVMRVQLEAPGQNVNTIADEFAPIAFSDDILYYTSNMQNKVQIYRSQQIGGNWTQSVMPRFPSMPDGHFGNGTFSPDGKRFYFTICAQDQQWRGSHTPCNLYVTRRIGSEWEVPHKMRDYLKMDGQTATQPAVAHVDDIEYLYYVSDRRGGQGGLDIWYTTRKLTTDDFDYDLPQNAGPVINTPQDEVTPFYDSQEGALYFASDGYAGFGGYDIFKATGNKENWQQPEHLGLPYNSSADDYYFVKNKSKTGGFLVSNRLFGMEKIITTQDDIFAFSARQQVPTAKGSITSASDGQLLDEVTLSLYELRPGGRERLLNSQVVRNGLYEMDLLSGRSYRMEARKTGFESQSRKFNSLDTGPETILKEDFRLSQLMDGQMASTDKVVFEEPPLTKVEEPVVEHPTPVSQPAAPAPVAASTPSSQVVPNKPKVRYYRNNRDRLVSVPEGVHYKIQFKTVLNFNAGDAAFDSVRGLGRLDTEYLDERGWTRVLLADYYTREEALGILTEVRRSGYPDAFLVKYVSGRRLSK